MYVVELCTYCIFIYLYLYLLFKITVHVANFQDKRVSKTVGKRNRKVT